MVLPFTPGPPGLAPMLYTLKCLEDGVSISIIVISFLSPLPSHICPPPRSPNSPTLLIARESPPLSKPSSLHPPLPPLPLLPTPKIKAQIISFPCVKRRSGADFCTTPHHPPPPFSPYLSPSLFFTFSNTPHSRSFLITHRFLFIAKFPTFPLIFLPILVLKWFFILCSLLPIFPGHSLRDIEKGKN